MGAIVVRPAPEDAREDDARGWMPFTTRLRVARELNALWAEFVTDMHDGPTTGEQVAEKFWQFVSTRGRPS